MENQNYIGEAIRRYRKEKGLSQDQLSRLSGISYNTIVKLEKKNAEVNPTIGTLQKIAGVFGVAITMLISEIGRNYIQDLGK